MDEYKRAQFVYSDEMEARQGVRFVQTATERALGVALPGPF